jgi:hypothetical protein
VGSTDFADVHSPQLGATGGQRDAIGEVSMGEQRVTVLDRLAGCPDNLVHGPRGVDECAELVEVSGELMPASGHASTEALAIRANSFA